MRKSTKKYIACGVLIIVGLGLCIGGIFMPPLLIAGVPIFTGGLSILAAIIEDNDKIAINTTINNFRGRSPRNADYDGANTFRTRYHLGAAGKSKINLWASKLRETFNRTPSQFKEREPTVVSFSNSYYSNDGSSNDNSEDYVTTYSDEMAMEEGEERRSATTLDNS